MHGGTDAGMEVWRDGGMEGWDGFVGVGGVGGCVSE